MTTRFEMQPLIQGGTTFCVWEWMVEHHVVPYYSYIRVSFLLGAMYE
jgi:hypothetical protein